MHIFLFVICNDLHKKQYSVSNSKFLGKKRYSSKIREIIKENERFDSMPSSVLLISRSLCVYRMQSIYPRLFGCLCYRNQHGIAIESTLNIWFRLPKEKMSGNSVEKKLHRIQSNSIVTLENIQNIKQQQNTLASHSIWFMCWFFVRRWFFVRSFFFRVFAWQSGLELRWIIWNWRYFTSSTLIPYTVVVSIQFLMYSSHTHKPDTFTYHTHTLKMARSLLANDKSQNGLPFVKMRKLAE